MKNKYPTYELEDEAKRQGYRYIAGIDEAGRGPGAGPVVAAVAVIPDEYMPKFVGRVKDSKKLTAKKRMEIIVNLLPCCIYDVGVIGNHIIDNINILEATKKAMQLAMEDLLSHKFIDYALIDGTVKLKNLSVPQQQVIKGDNKSISIAMASIIAKTTRDAIMKKMHELYPVYGWKKNKGYLTKEHIDAINKYGVTEFHRLSFRKVGYN